MILKDTLGERVLPIWVGVPEASAGALRIDTSPRLARWGTPALEDHPDLLFRDHPPDRVRGARGPVDARPSSAIALAIRTRSLILAEDVVIDSGHEHPLQVQPRSSSGSRVWIPRSLVSTKIGMSASRH